MESKLKQAPSEHEIAKLIAEVRAVSAKVAHFTINLDFKERRELARFRPGGEKIVSLLSQTAADRNFNLPGVPLDLMTNGLTVAERLQPLIDAVELFQRTLTDTALQGRSESWRGVTAYYSAMNHMHVGDPVLQVALRPASEFFSTGRRKAKVPIKQSAA